MTIDWWTLGIQTVNVLILIWLLERFFWRPVAAMIEERRAAARKLLDDAQAERDAARADLADIARTRDGFRQEHDAIIAAARKSAEEVRAEMLDAAAHDAAVRRDAANAAIARQEKEAHDLWADRASRLAVDIAGRLAQRLDGAQIRAAFLDWLGVELKHLPASARAAAVVPGVTLDAVSAAALDADEEARCRAIVAQALGAPVAIVFKVDASLIAGIELRGPQFAVSNSWRADLERIRAELTRDATA